jgi:hypothetical protein
MCPEYPDVIRARRRRSFVPVGRDNAEFQWFERHPPTAGIYKGERSVIIAPPPSGLKPPARGHPDEGTAFINF